MQYPNDDEAQKRGGVLRCTHVVHAALNHRHRETTAKHRHTASKEHADRHHANAAHRHTTCGRRSFSPPPSIVHRQRDFGAVTIPGETQKTRVCVSCAAAQGRSATRCHYAGPSTNCTIEVWRSFTFLCCSECPRESTFSHRSREEQNLRDNRAVPRNAERINNRHGCAISVGLFTRPTGLRPRL